MSEDEIPRDEFGEPLDISEDDQYRNIEDDESMPRPGIAASETNTMPLPVSEQSPLNVIDESSLKRRAWEEKLDTGPLTEVVLALYKLRKHGNLDTVRKLKARALNYPDLSDEFEKTINKIQENQSRKDLMRQRAEQRRESNVLPPLPEEAPKFIATAVVDIDGTINSWTNVGTAPRDAEIEWWENARDVLNGSNLNIIYLTGRKDRQHTRHILREKGFPTGQVRCYPAQLPYDPNTYFIWKTNVIASIVLSTPYNVYIFDDRVELKSYLKRNRDFKDHARMEDDINEIQVPGSEENDEEKIVTYVKFFHITGKGTWDEMDLGPLSITKPSEKRHKQEKDGKTYCESCDRWITSRNWKIHVNSKKHKENL